MSLEGKHILLGVTGGIAAYKSPILVRELTALGASVQVVMTPAATRFVTPETLSVVSRNPVIYDWFRDEDNTWNNHVMEGIRADLMLIAPATANTMASMATGACPNVLLAVYLSARCPVIIAPAMDHDMFHHPATILNMDILQQRGHQIIPPAHGELASGITGDGRLPEPSEIREYLVHYFSHSNALKGKNVLITSGPTFEAIDPVRFIGNHSTGRMGTELAMAAASMGANVQVISGPAVFKPKGQNINVLHVQSAEEMLQACEDHFQNADIAIFAAAVADYRPKMRSTEKIKKNAEQMNLELVRNPDILGTLSKKRRDNQILMGFALETEREEAFALKKLEEKHLDFIVMNSLRDDGAGFGETNKVTLFGRNRKKWESAIEHKSTLARRLLEYIIAK